MDLSNFNLKPSDEYTNGLINLPWYGSFVEVRVSFNNDNEGEPSPKQLQAFASFLEHKDEIFNNLESQLFEYYKEVREEASGDYDKEYFTIHFPELSDKKELSKFMKFKDVLISYYDEEWSSFIGLVIDCDWDVELGVGVKLIQNKVREIDVQDIVI